MLHRVYVATKMMERQRFTGQGVLCQWTRQQGAPKDMVKGVLSERWCNIIFILSSDGKLNKELKSVGISNKVWRWDVYSACGRYFSTSTSVCVAIVSFQKILTMVWVGELFPLTEFQLSHPHEWQQMQIQIQIQMQLERERERAGICRCECHCQGCSVCQLCRW